MCPDTDQSLSHRNTGTDTGSLGYHSNTDIVADGTGNMGYRKQVGRNKPEIK